MSNKCIYKYIYTYMFIMYNSICVVRIPIIYLGILSPVGQ